MRRGNLIAPAGRKQMERGLLWACEYGRNEAVQFLLDRGADIHADGGTGMTPLHWAVLGGHAETIKLLMERGANPETRNRYGGTALGQALWGAVHNEEDDSVPVIEALIEAGARVEKDTFLWLSEQKLSPEVRRRIEIILKREREKQ